MNWIKSLLFALTLATTQQIFAGTVTSTNVYGLKNATVTLAEFDPSIKGFLLIKTKEYSGLEISISLDDIREVGIDPMQFANLLVNSDMKMVLELHESDWKIVRISFSEKPGLFD